MYLPQVTDRYAPSQALAQWLHGVLTLLDQSQTGGLTQQRTLWQAALWGQQSLFPSYLSLPLITSDKVLCLSFKHVGLRRNGLSAIWVFAIFSTQALLHYVRILSPLGYVSLRELGKGK